MTELILKHAELIQQRHRLMDQLEVAEFEHKRWEREAASAVIHGREAPEKPSDPELLKLAIQQIEQELEDNRAMQKVEKLNTRKVGIEQLKKDFDTKLAEYREAAKVLIDLHCEVDSINSLLQTAGSRGALNMNFRQLKIPDGQSHELMFVAIGPTANKLRGQKRAELQGDLGIDIRLSACG